MRTGMPTSTQPSPLDLDALVPGWLTVPDVAERLGVPVTRVRQLIAERQLLAVRRDGVLLVPAVFVTDAGTYAGDPAGRSGGTSSGGRVLKGLPGTLTVLADAGYRDEEALRWLFTADPSLPGAPVQALAENRGTEVKRRAQALAF